MELSATNANLLAGVNAAPVGLTGQSQADSKVREAFDSFVGETFYAQMLKSLRAMTDKPAYFHGGRGEEVFQGQLDQIIAEDLSKRSANSFTGPMFELFNLQRS